MVAKEIIQAKTSINLTEQNGFDGGKIVADSSGTCTEVQDGIFDMEDVGEEKVGTKKQLTDEEPSVRLIYNSLPRSSKRKLVELLNCWSEWHSQNCSSEKDPVEPVEYGEETYFPAIQVGLEKFSSVSFSMDSQVRKRQRTESFTLDNSSAPLYDRDYSIGLTPEAGSTGEKSALALDLRKASRCFNCGSFNHSLKECPKPHNHVAVSNARKEFQSKKNKNSGPHIQTRYYQNSPDSKYDGLKPGCLAAETRELLGLKDLQPPPWLNRMRQLGYPPGYLDLEEKDQPSGIAIFGDEGANDDGGDEPKSDPQGPQKKMTVDFPGVNAPIPENANPKEWEEVQAPSGSEFSSPQPDKISNHLPGPTNNWPPANQPWRQSYPKLPTLHYNYDSPPLLNLNRPNNYHHLSPSYSSEPSPPGVPIPRSPRNMTPHFSFGTPPFPNDYLSPNPNSPLPNSFMYQNSWHSPAWF